MFTDITGCRRLKACLHLHTTLSDGQKTPEEAIALYEKAGYDIIAITDHWKYYPAGRYGNMRILSGCEYDVAGFETADGPYETFHIVGLNMERQPELDRSLQAEDLPVRRKVRKIVDAIHAVGGTAVLAHPAWSLNTPVQIMGCCPFDATEIYNSVSDWGMSDRPYSGQIVDMLATLGVCLPLLATDDVHYYDGDQMRGMTMLEADAVEELGFGGTVKAGRFYSTQGPEAHLERISPEQVKVTCTPAVKIAFLSNVPWAAGRMHRGKGLTEATFTLNPQKHESYIRAEVTDENGLCAWSNIIAL